MKIYTRQEWGCKPHLPLTPNPVSPQSIVFIHHSAGRADKIDTIEEMKEWMRTTDQMHRNKSWVMIGYSYVVFQPRGLFKRAKVFEARGYNHIPAAQLGSNAGNGAICVVGDFTNERLKRNTIWRVGRLAKRFEGKWLGGHYQATQTECPGTHIKEQLGRIAKIAGKKRL